MSHSDGIWTEGTLPESRTNPAGTNQHKGFSTSRNHSMWWMNTDVFLCFQLFIENQLLLLDLWSVIHKPFLISEENITDILHRFWTSVSVINLNYSFDQNAFFFLRIPYKLLTDRNLKPWSIWKKKGEKNKIHELSLLTWNVCQQSFVSVVVFLCTWQAHMYLGLLIMCGFVLFDTQLIIEKAENGDKDYIWWGAPDPLTEPQKKNICSRSITRENNEISFLFFSCQALRRLVSRLCHHLQETDDHPGNEWQGTINSGFKPVK